MKFRHKETIEVLNPEVAKQWLTTSLGNRTVRPTRLASMVRDLKSGAWQDQIADAVHFDQQGHMRNGHHRCNAVIAANTEILARVIWDCTEEEIAAIDGGIPRTLGDRFALEGHAHANSVATAVRSLYDLAVGYRGLHMSTAEANKIVARHPQIIESAASCHNTPIIGAGMLAALHFVGRYVQHEPEKADQFRNVFRTGTPAYNGDPAHLLRERLMRLKLNGTPMAGNDRMRALTHAWNLFRRGTRLKIFKVPEEVAAPVTIEYLLGEQPESRLIRSVRPVKTDNKQPSSLRLPLV